MAHYYNDDAASMRSFQSGSSARSTLMYSQPPAAPASEETGYLHNGQRIPKWKTWVWDEQYGTRKVRSLDTQLSLAPPTDASPAQAEEARRALSMGHGLILPLAGYRLGPSSDGAEALRSPSATTLGRDLPASPLRLLPPPTSPSYQQQVSPAMSVRSFPPLSPATSARSFAAPPPQLTSHAFYPPPQHSDPTTSHFPVDAYNQSMSPRAHTATSHLPAGAYSQSMSPPSSVRSYGRPSNTVPLPAQQPFQGQYAHPSSRFSGQDEEDSDEEGQAQGYRGGKRCPAYAMLPSAH